MSWTAFLTRSLIGFAMATLLAAGAHAAGITKTFDIDVSGIGSYGGLGDAANEKRSLFIASDALITGLSWNVELAADSPSWLSDISVRLSSSTGDFLDLSPGIADSNGGFGSYADGVMDLSSALGFDFKLGLDGLLDLEFYEFFDDFAGDLDGLWVSGFLSITANFVPAPASLALVALALLAAGAGRRRQAR